MRTLEELKQVLINRTHKKSLLEKDIECFETQLLQQLSYNEDVAFYRICLEHYVEFTRLLTEKGYVFQEGVCSGETTILIKLKEVNL